MGKGLGIAALVIAIIAIFVPFAGTWLTLVTALMAAFSVGGGFALGVSALLINVIHVMLFSPLLWATQGAVSIGANHVGNNVVFVPWILIVVQLVAFIVLVMLNKKGNKEVVAAE